MQYVCSGTNIYLKQQIKLSSEAFWRDAKWADLSIRLVVKAYSENFTSGLAGCTYSALSLKGNGTVPSANINSLSASLLLNIFLSFEVGIAHAIANFK